MDGEARRRPGARARASQPDLGALCKTSRFCYLFIHNTTCSRHRRTPEVWNSHAHRLVLARSRLAARAALASMSNRSGILRRFL